MTLWGVRLEVGGFRRAAYDLDKVLMIVRGFRFFVLGIAVASLAAAWIWHLLWLLVLALAIGGEEMLEMSIVIYALRRGKRDDTVAESGTEGPEQIS